jgi:serine/threonine-protein kinase HipA
MMSEKHLNVLLHGLNIGTITLFGNEQSIFLFTEDYINNKKRNTLSLSYKNKMGELITDLKPTRSSLNPFFSNLLPEGHMRDYLAQKAGIDPKREFFLLSALGQDLPGALQCLSDKALEIDSSKESNSRKPEPDFFRFSLAGVQLKFSALMSPKGKLTIPANGIGGSWILKLPSNHFQNVPENEFSMMILASKLGMNIPDVQLTSIQDIANIPANTQIMSGSALAVKRFDRSIDGDIHMEDFAQIFNVYPDEKYRKANYKNIAEVINIETEGADIPEFIRRLVFNTLIGNADMHLKNWSMLYPDKINARLSPGYDFVSTICFIDDDTMALNYTKTKKMTDLSISLLSNLAAKAKLTESLVLRTAKDTVQSFLDLWHFEKNHLLLSKDSIYKMDKHISKIHL